MPASRRDINVYDYKEIFMDHQYANIILRYIHKNYDVGGDMTHMTSVFWDVMTHNLAHNYEHFGRTCSTKLHGATAQNTQHCQNLNPHMVLVNEFSQNYWVFGLGPSLGTLNTREHDVLEKRDQANGETPALMGPIERVNLKQWTFHANTCTCTEMYMR
jgi:hypothetical protein